MIQLVRSQRQRNFPPVASDYPKYMLFVAPFAFAFIASALSAPLNSSSAAGLAGICTSSPGVQAPENSRLAAMISIPVYWHITKLAPPEVYELCLDPSQGNIPTRRLQLLNSRFAGGGLSFALMGVALLPSPLQHAATLNVYSVGFTDIHPGPYPMYGGVVILHSTVPGGSVMGQNEGKALTHEAGHWLDLYHTFQGGCFGRGDFVDDTSPEAESAEGCLIGRRSCFGDGVDP
ncbi:Extracellular metalloprotease [Ceratobasidium theobromae]|uniref:Extracellular metalloprotease n=1 Tax=Ceratobasidium theobromae TaxID=1582974 RepID=A0A5N5QIF8_9AGAM|nr:Extracellular metalloprotease [Ceratobasidium theobromae]